MRRNKLKLYCVFFSHLLFTLETHFADAKHFDNEILAFGLVKIDIKCKRYMTDKDVDYHPLKAMGIKSASVVACNINNIY